MNDSCLTELFESQAELSPAAIALRCGERALSYAELRRAANNVARKLVALGVGPDVPVILTAERSLETVVGLLGILKAGGAYVPIDTTHPSERNALIVSDSGARLWLTGSAVDTHLTTIELRIEREGDDHLASPLPRPHHLAYVLYTSGSTGKPKGTMVEHRNLGHYLRATREFLLPEVVDSIVHSPFTFDLTHTSFLPPLVSGGCVTLVPGGVDELAAEIDRAPDRLIKLTPSHLRILANLCHGSQTGRPLTVVGGEPLTRADVQRWRELFPRAVMINHYGPTETTVGVCTYRIPAGDLAERIPIGKPIVDTRIHVVDEHGRPVADGAEGELCISGPSVARGYLNREALTKERFVDNPFTSERMYRTGDRARWLADGNLEYQGRLDDQVKLRGYRIELGEVETALLRHEATKEAAVVVREDQPGDKRLVAYIVARAGHEVDARALRKHLNQIVPDYMVPAAFVMVTALPLTANGKLDRRALPLPRLSAHDYAAPRTPKETLLAQIVAVVLGVERVSVVDDFFELGGDSILLLQVVGRAKQAGLRISAKQMYGTPTVRALSNAAEEPASSSLLPSSSTAMTGDVPLTPIQRWFFARPRPHHYNQSVLLKVDEPIDEARLKRAIESLLRHQDALRMRYEHRDGEWRQVNTDRLDFVLECVHERFAAAATRAQAGLNVSDGPLVRAVLYRNGSASRLLLVIHHLVIDGVSWRILLEDLAKGYFGEALPKKTSAFTEWATRLHEFAQSSELRSEAEYWHGVGAGTSLEVDFEGGANLAQTVDDVVVTLSQEETQRLLFEMPKACHTQINDVLLTALGLTLARGRDLRIDLEGHGREALFEDVDVSRTVGWFTSLFPVCLRVETEPKAALESIKAQLRAIPRKGIGYGLLRYLSQEGSSLSETPAEVRFNYLGQFDAVSVAERRLFTPVTDEPHGPSRDPERPRGYLLDIVAEVRDGRLRVVWSYSRDVHQRKRVEQWAARYRAALVGLLPAAATEARLSEPTSLVAIQCGATDSAPVLCVPGAGCNVAYFCALAEALGDRTRVYGLQPRGLDGRAAPHRSVAEMASDYIAALGELSSQPPLRLIGHSFGGWTVFEMALQLRAAGVAVESVVMLDPPAPNASVEPLDDVGVMLKLGTILAHDASPWFERRELRDLTPGARLERLRQRMVDTNLLSPRSPLSTVRALFDVFGAHVNTSYVPTASLDTRVLLIEATESAADLADSWRRFAPGLEIARAASAHMSMLAKTNVAALAKQIHGAWSVPSSPRSPASADCEVIAPSASPSPYLHARFEACARRRPAATALVMDRETLSYGELDRRANQLAHRLTKLGIGPEVRVGLSAERGFNLVIGALAILKSGAACLPIDPGYPRSRIDFVLKDAAVALLLTESGLGITVHQTLNLDRDDWRDEPDTRPRVSGGKLAYVIYTSGSTGQPKGVMLEHHSLVNHTRWMRTAFDIGEADSVLQQTAIGFDASLCELWLALSSGGRLVIAPPGSQLDPASLTRTIIERNVTVLQLVPTMVQALVEHPSFAGCQSLRHVFSGGEVLSAPLAARFLDVLPRCALHNVYGPSEATIDATCWTCIRGSSAASVPIGRPIANARVYLLDSDGKPAPAGVPGELHIAGAGVARGYLNRPEATSERFIRDPFSDDLDARMYKTGDRARSLPDGNLEYLGRLDNQVKLRGQRIELSEVEAALCRHVAAATVVMRELRLVGYYVGSLKARELADRLRTELPDYMVPSLLIALPALPLNAHGKIDREALPTPSLAAPPHVAPKDELEAAIAAVYRDVLNIDRPVGADESFFDLGGDSLLAMRVIGRLNEALGKSLDVSTLLASPHVRDLANKARHASADALPAITRRRRSNPEGS